MINTQAKPEKSLTPEQTQLFKELMFHTTEVYSRTFLPLVLVNREKVIFHLKEAKNKIEQLEKVI